MTEPEVGGNMLGEEMAEEVRSSVMLDRGRVVDAMGMHRHPHSAEIAAANRLGSHRIGRSRGPKAQIAIRMVEPVCARLLDDFSKRRRGATRRQNHTRPKNFLQHESAPCLPPDVGLSARSG